MTVPSAAVRRGPFQPGDRVQLTDPKGRVHTLVLRDRAGEGSHAADHDSDETLDEKADSEIRE